MATVQVSLRLPEELVAEVDAYAQQLADERPGLEVARVDSVKVLLTFALAELLKKKGPKK